MKRSRNGRLVGCGFVSILIAAPASLHAQDVDAKPLYAQQCAMCHGDAGGGDGVAAAALDPKPTAFTDSTFQESRTDEQVLDAIANGKNTMPGFSAQLTPEQMEALVAYIREMGKQ